jgi:hypothetical protein
MFVLGFRGDAMFELTIGLAAGAVLGYGLRAFISYQRRATLKKRLGMN